MPYLFSMYNMYMYMCVYMYMYILGPLLRAYEGWASELNSYGMGAARRFAGKPDLFIIYVYICVYIYRFNTHDMYMYTCV